MLAKTPAIVLGSVKYGDNSLILKAYTREAGLLSFIGGGLHSKTGVLRPAIVQTLSQLHLVYYSKSKGDLKRIKEASVSESYAHLHFDPVKSSLAMFLAEVLAHVLHEEEANYSLFDFLSTSLLELDAMEKGLGSFHLLFLYRLTHHLGFAPEVPGAGVYFDLMNGVYETHGPVHPHYLAPEETQLWKNLHGLAKAGEQTNPLARKARESLLTALLEYYRLHLKDFGTLRSLKILKELLS